MHGNDDAGGSDIAHYDVYVRDVSRDYTPWLEGTTETCAIYPGTVGHPYYFYSIATDGVGHEELPPASPDAWTTVGIPRQEFHRGDADQNDALELTDAIQILSYLFVGTATRVPDCEDAADADDNGAIEMTDAIRILHYLFLGRGIIPAPGSTEEACGPDPTTDDPLGCVGYDPVNCATP